MSANLDQIVLELLESRRGAWQAVALASGVSYSWLSKFANGHIQNPGFATLTKLHENLSKSELVTPSAAPANPIEHRSQSARRTETASPYDHTDIDRRDEEGATHLRRKSNGLDCQPAAIQEVPHV